MSAPPDVLQKIVDQRRRRLGGENALGSAPALAHGAPRTPSDNEFLARLDARRRQQAPGIIAEIKRGSPRLGFVGDRFDPIAQARLYAERGAACLSVVVEPDHFFGSYELLTACREASGLPAIAKDFIVDPVQLVYARDAGASAVLLIAALLSAAELEDYAGQARGLGLVPLVETTDPDDLAKVAVAEEGWEIVGVNNRDLRTFDVSLERSMTLLPLLPFGAIRVAESGIRHAGDVALLMDAGFHAFLIGEALLLAENPGALLAEMTGAERLG
ncbi:MAG: indole-3-glycerol phosphate synthase TrpC [Acidobacteriota bacterium]